MIRSFFLTTALAVTFPAWLRAVPAQFDVGDDDAASPVQPGWIAVVQPSLSAESGGRSIVITPFGGITLDDRDRGTANGGGAEASLWRDFIFANGSSATGTGLQVVVSGLVPGETYPVTVWAFDKSSASARTAEWSANDGPGGSFQLKGTLSFDGAAAAPVSLTESSLTFDAVAGADGTLTLRALKGAGGNLSSHNVFLNGIRFGEPAGPPVAPVDLMLSGLTVPDGAPVGTLVGEFTTADPQQEGPFTYTLVSGPGDADNGLFLLGGVDGERLTTAAPLTGKSGQVLSIRVQTSDPDGNTLQKVFALTVTADSDNDGLDDAWERTWFPDLAAAAGSGDNDGDGLDNSGEFGRGTDPTKPDTDGDGLSDKVETGTGTFVSAADTGSSPLIADSDGDGLPDGGEVSPATGPATDPNRFDTDGDGFSDAFEIQSGTDPVSPASKPAGNLPLRLNEVLASNSAGLKDGFGSAEDWIEIFNPNAAPVALTGYRMTDNLSVPDKWVAPAATVPAQGYLLVFASGRNAADSQGNLHTSFRLDSAGETLWLIRPDGNTIEDVVAVPRQFTDISYGREPASGVWRFYAASTPRAANAGTAYEGVTGDTAFSVNRGFYDAPFSLTISTATPGAVIRYTRDGTTPTATSGQLYTGPLAVTGTSVIRAFASRAGWLPTNVDTQTYIFPDQVVAQPANPPGYPSTWGVDSEVDSNDGTGNGTVPADYQMDPRVDANAVAGYSVRDGLLAVPSLCITLPVDDFFSTSRGIWANPKSTGAAWERECSLELINPDGKKGFHENCVVELHGNSSRRPWRMQKHSLRVTFRSSVGAAKLDYRIFPDSPLAAWNKLVLRGCFTDGWGLVSWDAGRYRPNDSQYLRDVWMKDVFREMGQPSTAGNFCHVYVNGLYMGLYNPTERFDLRYLIDRFGGTGTGTTEGWEINDDLSTPGARWNALLAASTWPQVLTYLDAENFADYMLLHIFAEAEDWPHHNGYAATNPALGFPYRFFVWDQEIVLDNHAINKIDNAQGAGQLFQRMRTFPEFRLLFADQVRKHLFNGGALTAAAAGQTYLKRAAEIDKAIVAESARWGDTRSSMAYGSAIQQPSPLTNADHLQYPPAPNGPGYFFTREQSWLMERDNIVNNHLVSLHNPSGTASVITKLRAKNLYPAVSPADFAQHGGVVPAAYALAMTHVNATGTIYFTTDGSDPQDAGGMAYSDPVALTSSVTVKTRVRNGSTWSALTEAFFIVGTPGLAGNLVISEINYAPLDPLEEFVELQNVSAGAIDLSGVHFTAGIDFAFPAAFVMAPGERVVIVRDAAAFAARYGATPRVAGVFTGALDNNGETLTLLAADDSVITSFRYNDKGEWPAAAGGAGASLTLISAAGDPALPASWRASDPAGGTPGSSDSLAFTGDPAGDADGNGLADLIDYALVALPTASTPDPVTWMLSFDRVNAADGAVMEVQTSPDLLTWTPAPATARLDPESPAPGIVRERWIFTPPVAGRLYARVAVTTR